MRDFKRLRIEMSGLSLLTILVPLLVIGCGSGKTITYTMTAYTDPDFTDRRYDTLSVHMITDALDQRKGIEWRVVDELERVDLRAQESADLLPPTRAWDSLGVERTLEAAGISAAVRIREADSWIHSTWIPKKEVTTVTTEETPVKEKKKRRRGEIEEKEEENKVERTTEVTTTSTGGYRKDDRRTRYAVELVDLATGRIAWTGSLVIRNDDYRHLARRIVGQLKRDNMIAAREPDVATR